MDLGFLKKYKDNGNGITFEFEQNKLIVSVITDEIINIFVPYMSQEHYSKAIEGDKALATDYSVEEDGQQVTIATSAIRLTVKKNGELSFYDKDNKELLREFTGERRPGEPVSQKFIKLLEAEGHDVSSIGKTSYPVMTIMQLDKKDSFYGLGDKTGFLNKRSYAYENWNSDIPQAHNEDYRALYKSIPFLMCLKEKGAYGLFFDNTFHSYLNLGKESQDYFYYGADDGNLDYYFIGGGTLAKLIENYTYLTGRTPLPQRWTLGYQQSRWGYECKEDIRQVLSKLKEKKIPCDSIHFDIDYMDNFKVFTWDEKEYGPTGELLSEIKEQGIKPVVIIDPGTKKEKGYFMYEEGVANDYFAKDKDGNVYVNEVWPGESVFPDFGKGQVRAWWADKTKILMDMGVSGIWNDMNEPASFNGPLPMDVVFHDEDREIDHAQMHNVYGHFMGKATYEGIRKYSGKRPFVITRACYAGSQKYTTVWTGDNQSLWSHLQMSIPQLCNLGMSGFAFCGADIGGFGADATPELLIRWIQAAVFSPLYRNHSSRGSRFQEPWQFGDEVVDIYRKYVELRYKFIPYIYDLFYQGQKTGLPVMRPLVLHYENDQNTREINDEFLVGENILVAPVVEQGARRRMIYLPEGTWYDYWTGQAIEGAGYILREAPLDICPIYIKAGSLIPTYEPMNYIGEKPLDTLCLLTTPEGGVCQHYQDNGEDYKYQEGEYNLYRFELSPEGQLKTDMVHEGYEKYASVKVTVL